MIVLKQKRIINKKYKVTHEKINLSQEDGIFHSFRKKAFFILDSDGDMF